MSPLGPQAPRIRPKPMERAPYREIGLIILLLRAGWFRSPAAGSGPCPERAFPRENRPLIENDFHYHYQFRVKPTTSEAAGARKKGGDQEERSPCDPAKARARKVVPAPGQEERRTPVELRTF